MNALNKTIEINGSEYKVGYAKEIKPGIWSLGVEGAKGAVFMTTYHQNENRYTKLIRV